MVRDCPVRIRRLRDRLQRLHAYHHIAHNARPEELSTLWILGHDHGDPNDLCPFTLLSSEATMAPIGVR
jgi:hypothetical protein